MAKSVTEPITQAYERTVQILFKPFDLTKWFVLGFAAWLSQLAEGGGSGGNPFQNMPLPGGGGGGLPAPVPAPPPTVPTPIPGPPVTLPSRTPSVPAPPTPQQEFAAFVDQVKQFFVTHAWWLLPVIAAGIVLAVVVMWVRARGKFMFLDGVANDRAAVAEPWKRLRREANSYFRFELLLTVLLFLALGAAALLAYSVALADLQAQQFRGGAIAAIVIAAVAMLSIVLAYAIATSVANDFLIPLMYLRTSAIGPAWREFRTAVVPGNFWWIVLFYLMRFVLGIATAVIMTMGICLTCFVAALPYLGVVVFLPLFVFHRCYSLYFLKQFGPDYSIIVERLPPLMSAFPVIMPPGYVPPEGAPPPPPMQPPQPPVPPPPPKIW